MTISNKDKLLADWKAAASQLAIIKETDPMKSGIENVDVGWGYKLKIDHKLNYKLDTADDAKHVHLALKAIETSMIGGNIIADRLVKWKPELSISEYKKLDAVQKATIDKVLTVTPASKAVELVPPKA